MASLSEMIQAAEYKRQNWEQASTTHGLLNTLQGDVLNPEKNLDRALKIQQLRKGLQEINVGALTQKVLKGALQEKGYLPTDTEAEISKATDTLGADGSKQSENIRTDQGKIAGMVDNFSDKFKIGFGAGGNLQLKDKKPSETELFRKDLQRYDSGLIPEDKIREMYPDQVEPVNKAVKQRILRIGSEQEIYRMPLERVEEGNFFDRMQKRPEGSFQKEMNDATEMTADDLKTYGDLIALVKHQDDLYTHGVDIEMLFEYYNKELVDLAKRGLLE